MNSYILTQYIRQQQFLLLTIALLFSSMSGKAQITLSGSHDSGTFSDLVSITLTDFTSSPTGTQSLHLFISAMDCQQLNTAPSSNQNYIISYTPRMPGITDPNNPTHSTCEVMGQIQYFDGLGRPTQSVQVKGSPNGSDLVQPVVYDAYGLEPKKYLPYAEPATGVNDGSYKTTAITDQAGFYNPLNSNGTQLSNGVARISTPYVATIFEPSPLNRPLEQGAAGDAWQPAPARTSVTGHTVATDYLANVANEVPLWVLSGGGGAATTAAYLAGTLYKTVNKDENWTSGKTGTTEEFKDLQDHVILKRVWKDESTSLSTYYVYDDRNNLAYVIPPGVTASSFTEVITDAPFNQYIYAYHYDTRNRLSEKKLPGKGWEHMVYNNIDQVVAIQDAVQRRDNRWTFTKYDGQGRVIMTGEITDSRTHQQITDAIASQTVNWETPNGIADGYTTASSFPNSWNLLYTVNYYDDYIFPDHATYPSTADKITTNATGLLTGNKTRVLNTGAMLLTENYYDSEGRLRESITQNNVGGSDRIVNDYNFTDQLTQTVRTHNSFTITNLVITNQYVYDHMGRKTHTLQQTGTDQPMVVISKEDYNEIGQLRTKHLHGIISGSDTTYLQDINYAYNERGWLVSNSSPLFAMQLKYNDADNNITPQFNGNIANQLWGTSSSLSKRYDYTYDALNRLTKGVSSTGYSETGLSGGGIDYDPMGNIQHLTRIDAVSGTGNYTYNYSGNQLQTVTNVTGSTYIYDVNGNASHDGRTSRDITYNYLNQPQTMTSGASTITYTYDASGHKLQRSSNQTGTTDYDNGVVYDNGTGYIQTEEGRVLKSGSAFNNYEYNLSDHLGNSRITFDTSLGYARQVQNNDYYPFGMEHSNNSPASPKNEYLYNKKELQEELAQYDYGARFYDPVIARWTSVDPHAEKYLQWSPFAYGIDNPIGNLDFDGRDVLPSKFFLTTQFGKTFQDLRSNNKAFQGQIAKFENNAKYNLRLSIDDKKVKSFGAGAITQHQEGATDTHSFFTASIAAPGNSNYEYSQLGQVLVVGHEAIHEQLSLTGVKEDDDHNAYNKSRGALVDILKEYSTSNNLNLSDADITALSFSGQQNSKEFKSYIGGLAKQDNLSVKEEKDKYDNQVSHLVYQKKDENK